MIRVTFRKKSSQHTSYRILGHANYSERGTDIVCAAVSSLYISITNYLIANQDAVIDCNGFVQLGKLEDSQIPVEILFQGISDISDQYPDHLKTEVIT